MLSEQRSKHQEHITIHRSVDEIATEWDQLAERAGAFPWLRPGWIRAWWHAFGRGVLELVALRKSGRIVALVSLEWRRGGLWSTSNWHTPSLGFVAEDESVRQELAQAILRWPVPHVALSFLALEHQDMECCRRAARDADRRVLLRTLERSPFLPIENSWETYERQLDRKLLANIRSRRRHLERLGGLCVEVDTGGERLDGLLAEGFSVEAAGWKGERGTAITSRPETHQFYTEIARWAAERGWLRLGFLRLDERAIAFHYSLEYGGAHYLLKNGFDPAFRRHGPGAILQYEMLRRVFGLGLASYEFLGADEPWKLQWTSHCRERVRFQAFRSSSFGRLYWSAFAHGRPVAKKLLALLNI